MSEPAVEQHQVSEVSEHAAALAAIAPSVQAALPFTLSCELVDDNFVPGPNEKRVHFVRHGEGTHNVVQREWRAKPGWDGTTEPYTIDNDPEYKFGDAQLTAVGTEQAQALRARTASLADVELLVVSPMRRATDTGLLAFEAHVAAGKPILASELLHERGGRHTCDKRQDKGKLKEQFGELVDYSGIEAETDPFWHETDREPKDSVAVRGAKFLAENLFPLKQTEGIAIATHSAWLLSFHNAVLGQWPDAEKTELPGLENPVDVNDWYLTGEMRTVEIVFLQEG